jgi:hypothetical protein
MTILSYGFAMLLTIGFKLLPVYFLHASLLKMISAGDSHYQSSRGSAVGRALTMPGSG